VGGYGLVQTFKAVVAYDGTDFLGYQIQAQGRTVQGVLEKTLAQIAHQPIRVRGAGRTDTGVHATGQVIAFSMPWRHPTPVLQRAFNALLPNDVNVGSLTSVDETFHPRFDATSRQYRYTILNQPERNVLRHRYTTHVAQPLLVPAMQQASQYLIGTHDFASFGKPPQGNNTVRSVFQVEWQVAGTELSFFITANAFLYRMVRNIVGTLIQVGHGNLSSTDVQNILQAKDRSKAGAPALANGLCLMKVNY